MGRERPRSPFASGQVLWISQNLAFDFVILQFSLILNVERKGKFKRRKCPPISKKQRRKTRSSSSTRTTKATTLMRFIWATSFAPSDATSPTPSASRRASARLLVRSASRTTHFFLSSTRSSPINLPPESRRITLKASRFSTKSRLAKFRWLRSRTACALSARSWRLLRRKRSSNSSESQRTKTETWNTWDSSTNFSLLALNFVQDKKTMEKKELQKNP